MQAFDVNWLRWLFVMFIGGLLFALALYLGFYLPSRAARKQEAEELEEYARDIRMANNAVPPILLLLFILMAIFIVGYVAYIWLAGITY